MAAVNYVVGIETRTNFTWDVNNPLSEISETKYIEPICGCSWLFEAKMVAKSLAQTDHDRRTFKVFGLLDGKVVEFGEFAPPPASTAGSDIPAFMAGLPVELD